MNATCAISPTAETAAAAVAAAPRRVTRLTATSNIMTTRPRKSTGATLRTSITDVMSSAVKDPESAWSDRSEEHTSELQSRFELVCRLLLEKKHNVGEEDNGAAEEDTDDDV